MKLRQRLLGLGALVVLAGIVVGLPALLLALGGNPLPATPPSLDQVRDALLTPAAWPSTSTVDVRLAPHGAEVAELPAELVLHTGTASVPVRLRPLGGQAAGDPRLPVTGC